jgi:hypothetical protein
MKILPGRIEKFFVGKAAEGNKRKFIHEQERIISHLQQFRIVKEKLPVKMVSFSGQKHKADQIYSLASFYINVGVPVEWLIISDGTYNDNDRLELELIPGVKMVNWFDFKEVTNETLLLYGQKVPFGKRLHAYINQPLDITTIFTDTDILFFPSLKNKLSFLSATPDNWFLSDHGPEYMEPYYWEKINKRLKHYLNAGFLVMNRKPDWNIALDYICNRQDFADWGYLTEQVAINLMFDKEKDNYPLDKENFIFNNRDCFHLYHEPDYSKVSMRHFAGKQARVKMWQLNWQQVLNL